MFELNIKSSKDIQKLVIDFSDGSSVISGTRSDKPTLKEEFLNTKINYDKPVFEKSKPPVIKDVQRKPLVADELQNLNF